MELICEVFVLCLSISWGKHLNDQQSNELIILQIQNIIALLLDGSFLN